MSTTDFNGVCPFGEVYVSSYRKKDGTFVPSYCRKMTKKEIEDTYSGGVHIRPEEDGEGYYESTAKDPLEAINEVLKQLHYYDRGDIVYSSFDGSNISEKEFEKEGGEFYVSVVNYQKEYYVSGTVSKKRGKWVAGAQVEEESE